jgi:hypothetical protein
MSSTLVTDQSLRRSSRLRVSLWCLGLLGLLWNVPQVFAGESPSAPSIDEFKLITERNIFNPNRSARRSRENQTRTERAPRTESLALLGTLSYEKGEFAVFGGSEPSFRKVLKASDEVAGFKIESVSAKSVELQKNGEKIALAVGMQLERRGDGEWKLGGAAQPAASLASNTTTKSSATSAPSDNDDVVKRMMQRRAQEDKQ